ncbi:TonB-dependent receptor [Novosphingobium sp. Gsoil 351]|uniref:TonB-dependent receptor n=1 Tax=Novosphingobium sp. Gsoil 351 TaxID=2675225 RepID=UPI0018A80A03|nr:TonB-dependent receptor [Novosphingobium sp. Gsoil 351]
MKRNIAAMGGSTLTLALSCLAMPAAAQTASAENEVTGGEIIVTAQRREERLLDVPISVSAFTSEDIANRGVTSLNDLQASVPGLRLVDIGPGSQRIQLRGISQYLGLPTVGNYIDEFSINPEGASGVAEVRLLDLERIEVLRGPQPALYGEGSMGGTIRYVTASPDLTRFSGSGLAEVSVVRDGSTGYRGEAVLNLPLATDTAGLRVAAAHERLPGWTDGVLGKNLNDQDITTLRAKLLVRPDDALSISLLGLYHNSEQDVKSYSLADRTTEQTVPSAAKQDYYLGNLVVSYDLGPVTLLSSTGYLNQDSRSIDDSVKFYNQLFGAPLLVNAVTDARGKFIRWAQEARLSSNGEGPLRYLLGASYSDAKVRGNIVGGGVSAIPGLAPEQLGVVFVFPSRITSKVLALFGSVSYDIADNLTVDLGGRYFRDRRSQTSAFALSGSPVLPAPLRATFDSFNPRVNISLKTGSSGIVYANAAKGFRSGGFNPATVLPATFGPEKLWSYELGTRQSLIGNQLLVEAAVYYNDYKNIQATLINNPTLTGTQNAGKARGPGVDLTFIARPVRDFSVTGTLGWNKVEYKTLSPDRLPGDPLDLVPQWTWSASVDYLPQLNDRVGLIFHADAGFTDAAQITLRNFAALGLDPIERSQSRVVANLRGGVSFGGLEVYAFANNLFDENRIINPSFGAFFEEIRTRPRTLGVGVKGSF